MFIRGKWSFPPLMLQFQFIHHFSVYVPGPEDLTDFANSRFFFPLPPLRQELVNHLFHSERLVVLQVLINFSLAKPQVAGNATPILAQMCRNQVYYRMVDLSSRFNERFDGSCLGIFLSKQCWCTGMALRCVHSGLAGFFCNVLLTVLLLILLLAPGLILIYCIAVAVANVNSISAIELVDGLVRTVEEIRLIIGSSSSRWWLVSCKRLYVAWYSRKSWEAVFQFTCAGMGNHILNPGFLLCRHGIHLQIRCRYVALDASGLGAQGFAQFLEQFRHKIKIKIFLEQNYNKITTKLKVKQCAQQQQ